MVGDDGMLKGQYQTKSSRLKARFGQRLLSNRLLTSGCKKTQVLDHILRTHVAASASEDPELGSFKYS